MNQRITYTILNIIYIYMYVCIVRIHFGHLGYDNTALTVRVDKGTRMLQSSLPTMTPRS